MRADQLSLTDLKWIGPESRRIRPYFIKLGAGGRHEASAKSEGGMRDHPPRRLSAHFRPHAKANANVASAHVSNVHTTCDNSPMRLHENAPRQAHIKWLLDSDPAIRWQVMRDLTGEAANPIAAERSRVATEGWGAQLLAVQSPAGNWGGRSGALSPSTVSWS